MHISAKNINITANNITVSYTDQGPDNAPVIIFIHGFPFSKVMWNEQMESLNEKFRVIAYDVRGHGKSYSGTDDFSIELFVKDLIALMDALKIKKTTLCGLSMGGYIALNAIENHPKRFDALVLCDTQCLADSAEAKGKRMKAIEDIRKNGVEIFADESLKNFFAQESFITKKDVIAGVREMIVSTADKSIIKTLLALSRRTETCSMLAEIKVPVLILVGKEDKITPSESAYFMHEKINGSVLSVIEHAGHLSNLENPDQFNDQLMKFLGEKVGSRKSEVRRKKTEV